MKATALQRLHARRNWIVTAAAAGVLIGWLVDRAVGPLYESRVQLTFDSDDTGLNQASEVSAAVAAAFSLFDVKGTIERESALRMRQLAVVPDGRGAVAIELQAYGDRSRVQAAAGRAAIQARVLLSDASARTRIEQGVAERLPSPVRNTVRPWYEVTLRPQGPSSATAIRRRPALGGLLVGAGLAMLGVFAERRRSRPAWGA